MGFFLDMPVTISLPVFLHGQFSVKRQPLAWTLYIARVLHALGNTGNKLSLLEEAACGVHISGKGNRPHDVVSRRKTGCVSHYRVHIVFPGELTAIQVPLCSLCGHIS